MQICGGAGSVNNTTLCSQSEETLTHQAQDGAESAASA